MDISRQHLVGATYRRSAFRLVRTLLGLSCASLAASTTVGATDRPAPDAGTTPVARVLILQSFASDFAPFSTLSAAFRSSLAMSITEPVDFLEVPVATSRFPGATAEHVLVEYLVALTADRPHDLVVSIGGPATRFALDHRRQLLPATPLLILGTEQRLVAPADMAPGDAMVGTSQELLGDVENILQVLPDTERVAIVIGSSPLEHYWRGQLEQELRPLEGRVELEWLCDLPFAELLERAANLPPRSAILYTIYLVDGAGMPQGHVVSLTSLRDVAGAPLFGLFSSELGLGILGGRLIPIDDVARRGARAAACLLRGEAPPDGRIVTVGPTSPVFDGRALRRWRIREKDLPPGSAVVFRPESAWSLYRGPIIGGGATILVLSSLVVGLVVNRRRRRTAEREVRALSRRLISAQEDERRWLARELHDDLSQRLARLSIDAARLEWTADEPTRRLDLGSLQGEIVRLSRDVHGLSHRLHPSLLDDLGLEETLRVEVERFNKDGHLQVVLKIDDAAHDLAADAALCLYRIAQEALRNVVRHAAAGCVEVSLRRVDGGCELEVRDDGVGFDPQIRPRDPGLGLASMRERVRLVDGRLTVRSSPGQGTSVAAWVPCRSGPP